MKLFYSQNSPYARIARIATMESSLADKVECIRVVNRTRENPLLDFSPTCRVPTLVDDEFVLGETRYICAYLDHVQGRSQFFPNEPTDWQRISLESVVLAFLDSITAQVSESRRRETPYSDNRLTWEREKSEKCLILFDDIVRSDPQVFLAWDFMSISLAAAMSLMDFHSFQPDWQFTHKDLGRWLSTHSEFRSMIETAPV